MIFNWTLNLNLDWETIYSYVCFNIYLLAIKLTRIWSNSTIFRPLYGQECYLFLCQNVYCKQIRPSNLLEFEFRDQIQPQVEFQIRHFRSNFKLFWIKIEIPPKKIFKIMEILLFYCLNNPVSLMNVDILITTLLHYCYYFLGFKKYFWIAIYKYKYRRFKIQLVQCKIVTD